MNERSASREPAHTADSRQAVAKAPLHPLWVLLIAILLPGVGQVVNNTPKRGIMFLFFITSFGWVTLHLASPEVSFVGRYAGAFFIYAVSIMDAYQFARYRYAYFKAWFNETPPTNTG